MIEGKHKVIISDVSSWTTSDDPPQHLVDVHLFVCLLQSIHGRYV